MGLLRVIEVFDAEGNLLFVDKRKNVLKRLFISKSAYWYMVNNKNKKAPEYLFNDITESLLYDVYRKGEKILRGTKEQIIRELGITKRYFYDYEVGYRGRFQITLNDDRLPKGFKKKESGDEYNG